MGHVFDDHVVEHDLMGTEGFVVQEAPDVDLAHTGSYRDLVNITQLGLPRDANRVISSTTEAKSLR